MKKLNQIRKATTVYRRKKCPICMKKTMRRCGKIRAGPKNGFRPVYRCSGCGYRSLK